MSRRIILWRHGRTAWNVERRVQGQTDVPLDDVGRAQARDAAARLATLGPTRIVSSDLQRAHATARALGSLCGLAVETDPRLRETKFGEREGLTWEESWERFPEAMASWHQDVEVRVPGAELSHEAADRLAGALADVAAAMGPDDTVVVVSHGAIIRTGACRFVGLPRDHWRVLGGLNNCAWVWLDEDENPPWRIGEWNAGTLLEPVLSDDEQGDQQG